MKPIITGFFPIEVLSGETITINGLNFNTPTVSAVTIGGVAPTGGYMVVSDTVITAVVGAGNIGAIIVTNADGTVESAGFVYVNSASPVMDDISLISDTYYNFISRFTGEPFTVTVASVKEDHTPITDVNVDNIVYFKFDDGTYGIRNWPDNVVNAAEFGMVADSYFNLTTAYPIKNCDSLVKVTNNDFTAFCAYLSMGNKTGLIPSNKEAVSGIKTTQVYYTSKMMNLTGSNITLRIEGDIIAVFDIPYTPPPPPTPLQTSLLYVYSPVVTAPISNVRIIGNGCTLDMSGQAIPWVYNDTTGPGSCTILFDNVINGYIENLNAVNGLADCIKMHSCQNPVVSGVTVSGSVNDNGITIEQAPAVGFDQYNPETYTNGLVINCKAFNCQDYGISSFAARNTHIINCESWNCGTDVYLAGIPQNVIITPSSTGGALPAGTYYYVIVSINSDGTESPHSLEVMAAVTGATSSIKLDWDNITGDTYRIYRGVVTGAYTEYYESSSNTFTDKNAAGAITKFQINTTAASGGGFSDEINDTNPPPTNGSDYKEPTGTLFENCKAVNCRTNGLVSDSTYVRIRGLIVDDLISSSTNAIQGHGISLLGNTDFIIDGCDIHGSDTMTGRIPKNGILATSRVYPTGATEPSNIFYPQGIISNNNISNCGQGGVNVQGCDFINCYGNTLTATNQTPINGFEILISNPHNPATLVGNSGKGTAIIRGNLLMLPSAKSIRTSNVAVAYIEDNDIDGIDLSAPAINVNSDYIISGGTETTATIKGNTLQNMTIKPTHIATVTKTAPGAVSSTIAMGNTADQTISQPYDFSQADNYYIDYDNRYQNIAFTIQSFAVSFTINLARGYLVTLQAVTTAKTVTFPTGSDGLVFTIWAQTATGSVAWNIGGSVIDATGATVTSLAPGAFYRFVYYAATTSWVKMN